MNKFNLVEKSKNRLLTTFHVTNANGEACGSINVPHGDVADLLKCWTGERSSKPQQSQNPFVSAMMKSKHRGMSQAAIFERLPMMSNGHTGVSAMVRAAVWLEVQLDIEVLSIGRGAFERSECTLEASGKHLAYFVVLDGGFVFLRAQVLDLCNDPQELLSIGDTKMGWQTICKVIQALERNEVKSLERPIEAGSGPNGYVID